MTAQDHFSGIKIQMEFSLLGSSMNPAELSNLNSKYEINFQQVLMLQIISGRH
jgi:hypothetical protein